jgi:hypothetical protein
MFIPHRLPVVALTSTKRLLVPTWILWGIFLWCIQCSPQPTPTSHPSTEASSTAKAQAPSPIPDGTYSSTNDTRQQIHLWLVTPISEATELPEQVTKVAVSPGNKRWLIHAPSKWEHKDWRILSDLGLPASKDKLRNHFELLKQLEAASDTARLVSCYLKVDRNLLPTDDTKLRSKLEELGIQVGTIAKDILTIQLKEQILGKLLSQSWVRSLQPGSAIHPRKSQR